MKYWKLNVKNRNVGMAYCKLKWLFAHVSFLEAAIGGVVREHFIKRETLAQVFSCEILWNLQEHLFYRTPLDDCFCILWAPHTIIKD